MRALKMTKNNGGLTQPEVNAMIGDQIQRLENRFRSLGCGTEVGCIAGKRHEQMHAEKLNSDIENLKTFRTSTTEKEKIVANKFSEVLIMLNDVLGRMTEILHTVDRNEKNVDKLDTRLWLFLSAVGLMCFGTIWATYTSMEKISASVKTINSVDIKNQVSTETYMALMLEQFSGKSIDQILKEHSTQKEKIKDVEK
jgi:hypothetical protein